MKDEMVQMPRSVYERLLEHLQAHAPTDSWAKSVLFRVTAGGETSLSTREAGHIYWMAGLMQSID